MAEFAVAADARALGAFSAPRVEIVFEIIEVDVLYFCWFGEQVGFFHKFSLWLIRTYIMTAISA